MTQLLRRFPDASLWAKHENSELWPQGDCPSDILVTLEGDGLSVWKVNSDAEIERVVAATALERTRLEDYSFALIEERSVLDLGIKLRQKPAKTVDDQMNTQHYELHELTGKRLIEFAKLAIVTGEPITKSRGEILETARAMFKGGMFNRDTFAKKDGKGTPLLQQFFREKTIDFV
jgi:hypothetical protein